MLITSGSYLHSGRRFTTVKIYWSGICKTDTEQKLELPVSENVKDRAKTQVHLPQVQGILLYTLKFNFWVLCALLVQHGYEFETQTSALD